MNAKLSRAQIRALDIAIANRSGEVHTGGTKYRGPYISEGTAKSLVRLGLVKWSRFAQSLNSTSYKITAAGRKARADQP